MSPEEMLANSGNAAWMLTSASLVLLMTPGLAFFYGGMSQQKSVLNMMMMSFGAMFVVAIVYVLWGWSMSYGTENIGGVFADPFQFFGLKDSITDAEGNFIAGAYGYANVIDIAFQVTLAIVTVALISGSIAGRVKYGTWLAFAGTWVTLVYFPLAHMVWGGGLLSGSENSFAAKIFGTIDNGDGSLVASVPPIDFAGGTVVHINAGIAGLVLALIVGNRAGFGRVAYRPHNLPFVMLGAALLWFGWFGFNAGSAFAADGNAGLAWVNTTTATATAIAGWLIVERIRDGHATSLGSASGAVAGLVAITPAAGSLTPIGSMFLGTVAGVISALAVGLKFKFGYDDSLDVVGVHLVAGLWGTIGIGFFASTTGLFYGGDYKQLVIQIVIALGALTFTGIVTTIIGFALRPLGWRVSEEDEANGIDGAEHAETAYDFA